MMAATDRSCVHLCLSDYRGGGWTYTLHHIDVAPFFSGGGDPDSEAMEEAVLPPPAAHFDTPPCPRNSNDVEFHLLGDRVVSIGRPGPHPHLRRRPARRSARPYHVVSAAVGDGSLYVLDYIPIQFHRRCFEALPYDPLQEDWFWHALPRPPYVRAAGYTRSRVTAIWTTTEDGVGTYSFHTERRDPVVVLTAVEIEPSDGGGVRMVKRSSSRITIKA